MAENSINDMTLYQIPIDAMSVNIAVYRAEGDDFIFVDFNKAAEKTEQIKKEKLIGKRLTEVFPGVKEFGFCEVLQRVYQNGGHETFDLRLYEDERISGWRKNEIIKLPSGDIMAVYEDLTKEKQLEERVKQVNSFIDSSQTIVFFWRPEDNWPVEYVSKNIKAFGYSAKQFLSGEVHYADIIHPEDLRRIREEVKEYTRNGTDRFVQIYRILTADGETRWIDDRTVIERDGSGEPTHYLGTVVDITEQKEVENRLKQSEEKFRTIAENSLMGIFIYTDHYVYANEALADMSGYSIEEIYQMEPWEMVVGPAREQVKKIVLRRLKGEKFPQEYNDLKLVDKNGAIKTARVMTQTIKYGDGYAGLGTIVDVTDIKETKQKLKLLAQAMEQTDELVRITDKNGVITYVNDAFVAHTGYKHTELIGQNAGMLKSGEHDRDFYKKLWETILAGKTYRNIFVNRKKDQSLYYEEETITPIFDERQNIRNFIATGTDITERIKMEAELQRRATTDQLTGVYNRHRGNELIESEIERVKRYKSGFAVIMFDIDNFKKVNDTYGHDTGDYVLRQLSKIVAMQIRKSDALLRWGGEEFIVIVPHIGKDEAIAFAEKLRSEIEAYRFDTAGSITISVGASVHQKDEGKSSLLKRVDDALYEAKAAGRNCVRYR
ncbi:MAG: PAS domain S-box protein [Campylobacterota bacterium]|nr:PAS domain S-box protein [Campylobacterota bacterium]